MLIHAGMIEVMSNGGQQTAHDLQRCKVRLDLLLFDEAVHGLRDIRCVHRIVVRICIVVAVLKQPCGEEAVMHDKLE